MPLVLLLLWLPAPGQATGPVAELGGGGPPASRIAACPQAPCEVITDTTGFQASLAGAHNTMVAQHAGRVTSWSITLGAVTTKQIAFFDQVAHGASQAALVVLRHQVGYRFRVSAASPVTALTPFFGQTMTFKLRQTLPVARRDILGLSVPTWAPALAVGLDATTAWRASRPRAACASLFTPTAQITAGALAPYECIYRTARLIYSATIASPAMSAEPLQAPRFGRRLRWPDRDGRSPERATGPINRVGIPAR